MSDRVLRVQSQLTDRDHVLLGWLADHGVLTTFQIATVLFPSLDYAQERLRKLLALAVVDRFRPQRPNGGSHPYHYVLAQLGVDVVSAQRGEPPPRRDHATRRRWHLTPGNPAQAVWWVRQRAGAPVRLIDVAPAIPSGDGEC